jgi:hypothetical protein
MARPSLSLPSPENHDEAESGAEIVLQAFGFVDAIINEFATFEGEKAAIEDLTTLKKA